MRILIFISFVLLSEIGWGQKPSKQTPYYDRDSVYISGIVKDEFGKPIENVMVLLHLFYTKKFDVTWFEKDTFYTNENGEFSVALNGGQFSHELYFKKIDLFPSRLFLAKKSNRIIIDSPIILLNRHLRFFDTKEISKEDLGLTIKQTLEKYKISVNQTQFLKSPHSPSAVRGLRFETADSSVVLLATDNYIDTSLNKTNILDKKVIGIGIAFTNGKKSIMGKGLEENERRFYNEYYLEKRNLLDE